MLNNKILFYAPLNNFMNTHKIGGGEIGCKRTFIILSKSNYNVKILKKPILSSNSFFSYLFLFFNFLISWTHLIYLLFFKNYKSLHIVGFYKHHILFEWLIFKTAFIFNIKIIYEIRNGNMIEFYNNSNILYKYFFRSIILNSSKILCQGESYISFLKFNFGIDSIYYPNFIMDNFIKENNLSRTNFTCLNLIYFGRIVPEKNINLILDICEILKNKNIDFKLNLIGGYKLDYYNLLQNNIRSKNITNFVHIHDFKDFNDISKLLETSHFFIYPSIEPNEGHSNALTEAMAYGVVPIVNNIGFNINIVNDNQLISNELNPSVYVKLILDIWLNKKWDEKSSQVYNRVLENFTEKFVTNKLLKLFN
jgi:glycosyltransferase involved in cell wall biosynthesis